MTRDLQLGFGKRMLAKFWRKLTMVWLGTPVPFMEEFLYTHTFGEFLHWAKVSWEVMTLVEKRWGRIEGQLIIGMASLWSGCRFCGVGHFLSHNLELFKLEGVLGPVDERKILQLQMMTDDEVLEELLKGFSGPRWEAIAPVIKRQYLLRSGQVEEESRDDRLLQLTNHMWEWYNECTITVMDIDPTEVAPQAPGHAKDKKLIQRYREARAEQDAKQG